MNFDLGDAEEEVDDELDLTLESESLSVSSLSSESFDEQSDDEPDVELCLFFFTLSSDIFSLSCSLIICSWICSLKFFFLIRKVNIYFIN